MTEDAGDFASKANQPEAVGAVSEGFVFDFDDFVVKVKCLGKRIAGVDFAGAHLVVN